KSGNANIILDLNHRDKLLDGKIKVVDDKTILVYRKSEAWATNQQIWAKIEFNKSINFGKSYSITKDYNNHSKHIDEYQIFTKQVQKGEELLVKVSLSFTGFEGAELNSTEIPDWDFDKVKKDAETAW